MVGLASSTRRLLYGATRALAIDASDTHWSIRYSLGIALVGLALAGRFAIAPVEAGYAYITFYPAVIISAMVCGPGTAVLTSLLCIAAADFLFVAPYRSFAIAPNEVILFSTFCFSCGLLCILALRQARTTARQRRSERQYFAVLEDQSETICRYLRDGTLTYVNDAFCRTVGKAREELVGHTWNPIPVQEDIPLIEQKLAELSPSNPVVAIENRIRGVAGDVRWMQFVNRAFFDQTGGLVEIQSVGRDITDRKQLELKLAAAVREVEHLYDNAPCGYHSLGPDGTILRINSTELDWLGCRREDVVGKLKLTEFFSEDGKAQFRRRFPDFIQAGHVEGLEYELISRNGRRRYVAISATAVKDASGQLLMTRGVAFDITEKRLLENALLDATNREQQRLGHDLHDGLGQVLTGVSMLAAALARSEARVGRPIARELSHLEELTRKAVATCRDIAHGLSPLSYAKGGLIEAIDQMVQAQRESFGTPIRFQASAAAPLRLSHVAQDHLYRIAQEAVTNARKHAQAQSVRVMVDVQPKSVRIEVRDDGSGLKSAEMESGGMGLTIMRHRAAAIGARLSIGSDADGGTRLSCECPQPLGTGLEGEGVAEPVAESVVRTDRMH